MRRGEAAGAVFRGDPSRVHTSPSRLPNRCGVAAVLLLTCLVDAAAAQQPDSATIDDGVARYGAWELYCSDDAAAGLRRCHVEQDDILVVGIEHMDGTRLEAVEVTGDPPMAGSKVTYQVDAGPTLAWPLDGDAPGDSAVLLERMLHGRQLVAHYLSFEGNPFEFRPDDAKRTARADLDGFAAAFAEMRRQLDGFRAVAP